MVVGINGVPVKTSSELTREVAKGRPGDTLKLEVIRDGKRHTVEVRSGTRPSEKDLASNDNINSRCERGAPAAPLGALTCPGARHCRSAPWMKPPAGASMRPPSCTASSWKASIRARTPARRACIAAT